MKIQFPQSASGKRQHKKQRKYRAKSHLKLNDGNPRQRHAGNQPFLIAVPDFVQADWLRAQPRYLQRDEHGRLPPGRRSIGEGLRWAIHQAVVMQRTSRVVIADVVLAQVLWGGEKSQWSPNWRHLLLRRLERACSVPASGLVKVFHLEADPALSDCPETCALHATPIRHHHVEVTIRTPAEQGAQNTGGQNDFDFEDTFLGALEVFGYDYPERLYHWTPGTAPSDEEEEEEPGAKEAHKLLLARIKTLKKHGRLAAVYFPLKLFGPSPRVGLTFQQRQLHQAITRELTRAKSKAKSERPDNAEIILGGSAADDASSFSLAACPYLEKGKRYVGFNGNGTKKKRPLHGRGYKPVVWMRKAGYEIPEGKKSLWKEMRTFLRDVDDLAKLFGLVVAAWHPKQGTWHSLADLPRLVKTCPGRTWLHGCRLRIYTTEDFLVRWRRFFAEKMGFSVIPDTQCEHSAEEDPAASPEGLLALLNQRGITAVELARQLGVSRTLVSLHLSGTRRWTNSWENRVTTWIAGLERRGNEV